MLLCAALAVTDALAEGTVALYARGQPPVVSGAVVVTLDGFAVGYVPAWGQPAWSAQHETASSLAAAAKSPRNGDFHVCSLSDGSISVSPKIYAGTGFDLGHQTEAASQPDKPPTFGTCNMSPQRPNLNRMIWAGIELAVRQMAASRGELYVVTGPEIAQDAPRLGGLVSVPAKSWKAIDDPQTGAAAYVCTNTDQPTCWEESIAVLAAEIGFDPFPGLGAGVKAVTIPLPEPTKGGRLTQEPAP